SDSFTAASGSPTRISRGSPLSPELTSTWTSSASTPCSAAEWIVASISGCGGCRRPGPFRNDRDVVLHCDQVRIWTVGVGSGEKAMDPKKVLPQFRFDQFAPERGCLADQVIDGLEHPLAARDIQVVVG